MLPPRHPYRKEEDQGNEREGQATDGAEGEGVPEDFVGAVEEERDQAQGRGEDGQERRDDLVVECAHERTAALCLQTPFLDYVDAGVDYQAGEHDQCGEAALVEGAARDGEDEEAADEGYGDQADDGQRQQEGLEEDRTDEIDDGNYQQDEQHILPFVVIPAVLGFLGMIAYGENFFIEAFDLGVNDFLSKVSIADEFPGYGQGVLVVEAVDVVAAVAALDGPDVRETQRPAANIKVFVPQVPHIERRPAIGYQIYAPDFIVHGNGPHLRRIKGIAQGNISIRSGKAM